LKQSFHKHERLKSKKQIEFLFKHGKHISIAPIKIIYMLQDKSLVNTNNKAMFVVPKKLFKNAPDRNKLKRRMRESYRLNKEMFNLKLSPINKVATISIIYTNKEFYDFKTINTSIQKLLLKIG
jgi:ribonuclease P protein component